MVLQGAEILFYPTAIGSEPQDEGLDSREHWTRVMQGHAGANVVSFFKFDFLDMLYQLRKWFGWYFASFFLRSLISCAF